MFYLLTVIILGLIAFLTEEKFLHKEKFRKLKIIINCLIIALTPIATYYVSKYQPQTYSRAFSIPKNISEKTTLSGEKLLDYGEYLIMKDLPTIFMQSWLPPIITTPSSTTVGIKYQKESKVINEPTLKSIFKNNKFIKERIGYYRLVLPGNMKIDTKNRTIESFQSRIITFYDDYINLTIELYAVPTEEISGKILVQEKLLLLFKPDLSKKYRKWSDLMVFTINLIGEITEDYNNIVNQLQ